LVNLSPVALAAIQYIAIIPAMARLDGSRFQFRQAAEPKFAREVIGI
jgi:hypothetical protein